MSSGGHGGGGKRREVHEEHEEHVNHERWLVSYADMMTLLMVLFIVMFAISQVDEKKFTELKTGLAAGFGEPVQFMPGGGDLLNSGNGVAPDSTSVAGAASGEQVSSTAEPQATVDPEKVAELVKATEKAQVQREVANLKEAQEKLRGALAKAGLSKGATFTFDERGLVVSIATDEVLFRSGDAQLLPQGRRILDTLAPALRELPNRLSVDGHTNNIPISTAQFPSNWELSSDRATGVLRHLATAGRLPYARMSATGYAATRPLLPASNPKSVSVNRRVEVVVLARVDDSAGRAVAELGNARPAAAKPATAATPAASTAQAAQVTPSRSDGH